MLKTVCLAVEMQAVVSWDFNFSSSRDCVTSQGYHLRGREEREEGRGDELSGVGERGGGGKLHSPPAVGVLKAVSDIT